MLLVIPNQQSNAIQVQNRNICSDFVPFLAVGSGVPVVWMGNFIQRAGVSVLRYCSSQEFSGLVRNIVVHSVSDGCWRKLID